MSNSNSKTYLSKFLALFIGSMLIIGAGNPSAVAADTLNNIRTIDRDDLFNEEFFSAGNPGFTGVGFPPGANTLLIADQPQSSASLVLVSPPEEDQDKNAKISFHPIEIADPVNIAFDSLSRNANGFGLYRLFLLNPNASSLITVKADAQNAMIPASIKRVNAKSFGMTDPQGMTVIPSSGELFVLDGAGPRLVSILPKPGREFGDAAVASITLPSELGPVRGLAFNPEDNHLYMMSQDRKKLHKLTRGGELVASLDISGLAIDMLQGMVFAPSLDLTDPPSICHLYLATANGANGQVSEWALPGPF